MKLVCMLLFVVVPIDICVSRLLGFGPRRSRFKLTMRLTLVTNVASSHATTMFILLLVWLESYVVWTFPTRWESPHSSDDGHGISIQPDAETVTSIETTVSLFSIAYDTNRLSLLHDVFTPTATANFTGDSILTGAPAIIEFLTSTIISGGSQHAASTLHVNQTSSDTASVISYLQAVFFGSGATEGQILQNWGYYEDDMVKQRSGRWLVQNRVLHNFVSGTPYQYGDQKAN